MPNNIVVDADGNIGYQYTVPSPTGGKTYTAWNPKDATAMQAVAVSAGSGSRSFTLPTTGVYLVNVMASGAAGYDHVISQAAIVTYLGGANYAALGADMLGTAKKTSGASAPTGITLSAPTSAGVITATASGCTTSNVWIRFDIMKLSLV